MQQSDFGKEAEMYQLFTALFLIGVLMVIAGFVGRVGTDGLADVGSNAASALALLVVFSLILISHSSFSELVPAIETFVGGIPFIKEIADYGSLHNVLTQAPLAAAMSFMDVVLLSTIVDVINLFPSASGEALNSKGKPKFFVAVLTGVVLAFAALFFLNKVIKPTATYRWIVSIIGTVISLISLGTIPAAVITQFRGTAVRGLIGVAAAVTVFSKTKIAGVFRASFLKALVFVFGIWLIEERFTSLAAGVSQFALLATALGPAVIMIIGIIILLRSAF